MKEKTADKMFEELGYRIENTKFNIYIGNGKLGEDFVNYFVIHIESKNITIFKRDITLQELKAINKKCQELGWLDE